ncbi:MAG: toxin HicA [Chloroflexi bacterium HGW-Chloroflexi-10]|nr:MAG: toxin HicA [Chloroflexi bacterium HGW-Chloroflexi-10]
MSKKEKALAKLRQNPKNVRFEEIETILNRLGFVKRQDGTSHARFTLGSHIIDVPKRKPYVKPIYVKLLLEELDKIEELDSSE